MEYFCGKHRLKFTAFCNECLKAGIEKQNKEDELIESVNNEFDLDDYLNG